LGPNNNPAEAAELPDDALAVKKARAGPLIAMPQWRRSTTRSLGYQP
jgi:hypothetical protein